MSQNAIKFEEYLRQQNLGLDKQTNEEGVIYVVRENLEGFGPVALVILFNNNDRLVTVISYQYLKINDLTKKQDIVQLINDINSEYTMVKFTEGAGFITVQIALPFKDNFVPEVIVEMVAMLLGAIKEEQPRFAALLG
jgi:hypothetical protein